VTQALVFAKFGELWMIYESPAAPMIVSVGEKPSARPAGLTAKGSTHSVVRFVLNSELGFGWIIWIALPHPVAQPGVCTPGDAWKHARRNRQLGRIALAAR
jgi:hypothetical protein